MLRRDLHRVVAREEVGPYTLLRVARRDLDPGIPGQFFMLQPPGRLLPRPMSLCLAPPGELAFLIDPIGPGTRALCALSSGDELAALDAEERVGADRVAAGDPKRSAREHRFAPGG